MMQTQVVQAIRNQKAPLKGYGYTYSVGGVGSTLAGIASGASAVDILQIQTDAAFMVQALVAFAYNTTTNVELASPVATVQITDTGSGTTFFDEAQFMRSVFGTASLPLILPTPRILSPGSSLNFAVTNVVSANAITYQFSLIGQKLFNG